MKTTKILFSPNSEKFDLNIRISWLRSVLRFWKLNKPLATVMHPQNFSKIPERHSKKSKYIHCFLCGSDDHKMSACRHKDSKKLIEVTQRRHYSTNKNKASKNIYCVCKNIVRRKDMVWKPFTETSVPFYFDHVINLSANQ